MEYLADLFMDKLGPLVMAELNTLIFRIARIYRDIGVCLCVADTYSLATVSVCGTLGCVIFKAAEPQTRPCQRRGD